MSLEGIIARARRRKADVARDTGTVTRSTGEVFNPVTGDYGQPTTTIYTGPCLVRPASREGFDVQSGQQERRLLDFTLRLPVDVDIQEDDIFTLTDSTYDPGLIGKKFRITDVFVDGWQTARDAVMEQVT